MSDDEGPELTIFCRHCGKPVPVFEDHFAATAPTPEQARQAKLVLQNALIVLQLFHRSDMTKRLLTDEEQGKLLQLALDVAKMSATLRNPGETTDEALERMRKAQEYVEGMRKADGLKAQMDAIHEDAQATAAKVTAELSGIKADAEQLRAGMAWLEQQKARVARIESLSMSMADTLDQLLSSAANEEQLRTQTRRLVSALRDIHERASASAPKDE
jgi:hypothetical protein